MSIVLKLINGNSADSQIKIYRSTSPIDENALPEPIAVLPGNATVYQETDYLFYDVNYYYRIQVISASGESEIYPNTVHRLGIDVGPGPKELVFGDETFGFFGVFFPWEYESETADILRKFATLVYGNCKIVKYIRDGVIYYTTNRPINFVPNALFTGNALATKNSNPLATLQALKDNYAVDKEYVVGSCKYAYRLPQLVDKEQNFKTLTTAYYNPADTSLPARSEAIDLMRCFCEAFFHVDSRFAPFKLNVVPQSSSLTMVTADNTTTNSYLTAVSVSSGTFSITSNGTPYTQATATTSMLLAEYRGIAV